MTNDDETARKTLVFANMDKVVRNNHAKRAGLGGPAPRPGTGLFAGARGLGYREKGEGGII